MKNLFRLSVLGLALILGAQTLCAQKLPSNSTKKQVVTHLYNKMFVTRTAPVVLEKFNGPQQQIGYTVGKVTIMSVSLYADSKVGFITTYSELNKLSEELVSLSDATEIQPFIYKFIDLALSECGNLETLITKIQEQEAKQALFLPLIEYLHNNLYTSRTAPFQFKSGDMEYRGYTVGKIRISVDKKNDDTFMGAIFVDGKAKYSFVGKNGRKDIDHFNYIFLNLSLDECIDVDDLYKKITAQDNKDVEIAVEPNISEEKTIITKAENTTLYIFDYGQVDGDVVDYYLNGKLIEQNIDLTEKPYKVSINSNESPNAEIMLLAKSTGKVGACTIKVEVEGSEDTFEMGAKKNQFMKITLK